MSNKTLYEQIEELKAKINALEEEISKPTESFDSWFNKTHQSYVLRDYHFIDDWRCVQPLETFYEDSDCGRPKSEVDQLRDKLTQVFKSHGHWEGDGDINCIFLPPFSNPAGYTNCQVVFHVKQYNNGTSFLYLPAYIDCLYSWLKEDSLHE
jgi:hypothetical protein